jgi:hypothetical protein
MNCICSFSGRILLLWARNLCKDLLPVGYPWFVTLIFELLRLLNLYFRQINYPLGSLYIAVAVKRACRSCTGPFGSSTAHDPLLWHDARSAAILTTHYRCAFLDWITCLWSFSRHATYASFNALYFEQTALTIQQLVWLYHFGLISCKTCKLIHELVKYVHVRSHISCRAYYVVAGYDNYSLFYGCNGLNTFCEYISWIVPCLVCNCNEPHMNL